MNQLCEPSSFDLVTEKPAGERASLIELVCGDNESIGHRHIERLNSFCSRLLCKSRNETPRPILERSRFIAKKDAVLPDFIRGVR